MAEAEVAAPEASPKSETEPALEAPSPEAVEEEALTEAPDAAVEASRPIEAPDHKRKLADLEPHEVIASTADEAASDDPRGAAEEPGDVVDGAAEDNAKRQRVDGEADGLGCRSSPISASTVDRAEEVQKLEITPAASNGQDSSVDTIQCTVESSVQNSIAVASQQGRLASDEEQPGSELPKSIRKIEVPNNKVGVLIGKAGDTIRFLQLNSGARIQITRDAEADPNSSSRPVELIGSLESINKAEQLIKDVITEADAGGSPSLVARGFGTTQSGAEQLEIQVPNEKVGMIIGKGGETIKSLQMRSGARIQLVTKNLPEGDASKEKTVRISGNKKQIDSAREMIKEVMNQAPTRPSPLSGGYSQQTFRSRGPTALPQWGSRAPPPNQSASGYNYQQRGMYPPQTTQYPSQPHGGYSQQPPPRSSYGAGWDQKSASPIQTPQNGGYNYYGQGGQATNIPSSNALSGSAPASNPVPVNYNYGQSQAPNYGQQAPYGHSAPIQQSYGHGCDQPKYENQASNQQFFGQQTVSSQPGVYGQHAPDYAQQQPYSNPGHGGITSQGPAQTYGPQGASQPGDPMYQGVGPSAYGSSYGPGGHTHPYSSNMQSQPGPAYGQSYGPTSGTADGYTQPSGYDQGGQPVPNYTQQGSQSGGYGQYPSQSGYGSQPVPNNANYGYQGGSGTEGYGNTVPSSAYGNAAPVNNQAAYVQPPSNPSGYEQLMPAQTSYGGHPGSAPVGYT